MPRVEVEIEINKPIDETFQYLLILENQCNWQKEVKKVGLISTGDPKEGYKYYRQLKFLNVELNEYYEITKLTHNVCIEMNTYKSEFPFFLAFYTEKIDENKTKVKVIVEGNPKYQFMKFATPILVSFTKKAMNKGILNLKEILEENVK